MNRPIKHKHYQSVYDWGIDLSLLSLITFSSFAYGAVHTWAYCSIAIVCIILFFIRCFLKKQFLGIFSFKDLKWTFIFLILFYSWCFIQLIPLPIDFLEWISPKAVELRLRSYELFGIEPKNQWASISMNNHGTKIAILKWFPCFLLFHMVIQEVHNRKRIYRYIHILITIGVIQALLGLVYSFKNTKGEAEQANIPIFAHGTFINTNHYANFIAMITLLAMAYITGRTIRHFKESDNIKDSFMQLKLSRKLNGFLAILVATVVMLGSILSSGSRGATLSFILSFVILISAIALFKKKGSRITIISFIIILLSSIFIFGIGALKFKSNFESEGFAEKRGTLWIATLEYIKDYPITGSGLGTYENVFQSYKPEHFGGRNQRYTHAHNDYLHILSETGVIGGIILAMLAIIFLIEFLKVANNNNHTLPRMLCIAAISIILFMALHSITDFSLHIPSNALLFTMIIGLCFNALKIDYH